ncbi:MAG: site-specific DNA-methyltransferase [Candidatus Pacebacteria bacterium]|nr:site-specific DNA-methyltransferase [Candidatus Paceibacterota bacterium]
MDPKIRKQLIKILEAGKDIPVSFKDVLFPEEEKKMEYELVYGIKQREEDILADTWSVPFQPVKQFGNVKKEEPAFAEAMAGKWHNQLIFGDNLQALKHLLKLKEQGKLKNEDGTDGVRLIYIDPPFGTGDIYDARSGAPAYSAKLQGAAFIEFLRKRLIFLRELLADNGSIYVRIDYHFGHYVKVIMDEVFGKENFQNDIVIKRGTVPKGEVTKLLTGTDSLFYYSKRGKFIFNTPKKRREKRDWLAMHLPGERSTYKLQVRYFDGKPILPPKGRHWAISQSKIDQLIKEGRLRINAEKEYINLRGKKVRGMPEVLQSEEMILDSNWTDIPSYVIPSKWGFPTENSEQLLDRVISVGSNPGDLVLDVFAGSGTTGAVAEKLGRRWIMCDVSKFAIYIMLKRMLSLKEGIGQKGKPLEPKPFVLYNAGLYFNGNYLKGLDDEEYKQFALELFQAEEKEQIINGFKLEGVLMNAPVHIFPKDGSLTEEYIDDLHHTFGGFLRERMFIIAPLNRVFFLQDYIEKDGIRYYVLRIPYSVIDELHKNQFTRPLQPATVKDINQLIDAIGFDFIYPPEVEAKYYKTGKTLFGEFVIDIKKFKAAQRSKKPIEFKNREALSMVMVDKDYNGKYFDMDYYFFKDQIEEDGWKVKFSADKVGDKIAIIYLDVLGNERFEVKSIKDFKSKK